MSKIYRQLTLEQRYQIWAMQDSGKSQQQIAEVVGVHRSTISRELRRNRTEKGYVPQVAEKQSRQRRSNAYDTHGYSETIFGLTPFLGFFFAPRIKGVGKQTLYIFRPKNQANPDWKIAPDKTVNTDLIRANWDELLRLAATIKLKENTASDIFRRLNSYSRQHTLYQTLKVFGQLIKSLFILRYANEVELRQAIEKQLNKVELSNKFARAVAVGNPREYAQTEKEEQEIAEACNRLIKNSIICWNYLYLERQLEQAADPEAREDLLGMIATHSPMSWAHINMLGEYDFSEEKLKDSLGVLPPKPAG